jgi:hypothetical protein
MKGLVYRIGQLGDTIVSVPAPRAVRHHFGQNTLLYMLHDVTHRLVTAEMVLEDSGLVDAFIPYSPEKTPRQTPVTAVRSRYRADAVAARLVSLYAEIGRRA